MQATCLSMIQGEVNVPSMIERTQGEMRHQDAAKLLTTEYGKQMVAEAEAKMQKWVSNNSTGNSR